MDHIIQTALLAGNFRWMTWRFVIQMNIGIHKFVLHFYSLHCVALHSYESIYLNLTFMEPCIARCVFYITNEMQLIQCSSLLSALYIFRAVDGLELFSWS